MKRLLTITLVFLGILFPIFSQEDFEFLRPPNGFYSVDRTIPDSFYNAVTGVLSYTPEYLGVYYHFDDGVMEMWFDRNDDGSIQLEEEYLVLKATEGNDERGYWATAKIEARDSYFYFYDAVDSETFVIEAYQEDILIFAVKVFWMSAPLDERQIGPIVPDFKNI